MIDDREVIKANACQMSDDEWQAFTNLEAAKAIGAWLEGRGNLDRPIRSLSMRDLERMADAALTRWIVVNAYRLKHAPTPQTDLDWLLGA